MAMTINTNISSLNAQNNLTKSSANLERSLQRLSSGLRINSAKDDAAGLAISTRMSAQARGLNQAARNANDGISMAQTAEGALQENTKILQRIRELAIQSANDSNSSMDRDALNNEAQSLLAEAQRIAVSTEFNGKKLIDGSMTGAQFHVGAQANQTISVNVGNAQTSHLGSYQVTSGLTNVTGVALEAGDLLINGEDVGVSVDSSAESKTTAINAISDTTGVTATASTELTSANELVRNQTLQAGDLVINDVNIGAVAGSNNVVSQGENLANAINAVSNQTGVQAVHSQSTGSLTLTSSTGKDIDITSSTAAGATRLANASGLDVSDLSSATASTNTVTFANGTKGTNALTVTGFDSDAATTITALSGETVTIQGVVFEYTGGGGATGDNVEVDLTGVASNNAIATELNTAIDAQVTAGNISNATTGVDTNTVTLTSALNTTTTSHIDANLSTGVSIAENITAGNGAADGDTLTVGGVTYEFGFDGDTPSGSNVLVALADTDDNLRDNFIAAVTGQYTAGNTNIQADVDSGNARLTSDLQGSGVSNLAITEDETNGSTANAVVGGTASAGTDGTNDGKTGYGEITLNSGSQFLISGDAPGKAGLASATVSLNDISDVDISTVEGANEAISLLDGAMAQVTNIRGDLGAVQNRFDSTIANLQSTSENISAANSRILDADFAAETAILTKNQILQQAGTAMLAQANQLPQQVLTLLQ